MFPIRYNGAQEVVIVESIRILRKEKGWTQEQLADAVGVKRAVISKYESGMVSPSFDMIQKIAAALDVPIASLMTQESAIDASVDLVESFARLNACLNTVCTDSGVPDHIKRVVQETRPDLQDVKNALFVVAVKAAHSGDEDGFRSALSELSAKGRQEALKRIKEMAYVPDYQKEKAPPEAQEEAPEGE